MVSDRTQESTTHVTAPILVVEDDAQLRQLLRWTLESEGLSVETASDGQEALEWVARFRPALVVLDWGLPVVNGGGVAAAVRAGHGNSVPLVLVTADVRAQQRGEEMGAIAVLPKPFEIQDLVTVVRRALGDAAR